GRLNLVDDRLQPLARSGVGSTKRRPLASGGPRLFSGLLGRNHADEVQKLARMHPVGDSAPLRAEPHLAVERKVQVREPLARDERAPRNDMGEVELLLAEQVSTNP